MLIPRQQHRARSVGEVLGDLRFQAVWREDARDRLRLIVANFDRGEAAFAQQPRKLRRERMIGVESFLPGKQGFIWLMFTHTGSEFRALGNIGWIAENQVESLVD